MQRLVFRLTATLCAAIALAGCTSGLGPKPTAITPSVTLDGLYKFVEDGTGTRNGVKVDNLFKGETQWVFRTACNDSACVATGGKFDPANPSATPDAVQVVDYVDGKWSLVSLTEGAPCPRETGETFQSDQWAIWNIEGAAADNLSLHITVAGTDECNFINVYTPTMTRIGDIPADVKLPDPAQAPKRAPAPAASAFRGKYTVNFKRADNGEAQDSEHMDVTTTCLRSENRCVTTTVNVDPRGDGTPYSLQVYKFEDEKYRFDQTLGNKPCVDGVDGLASKTLTLPLPPGPVPDPLKTLTGQLDLNFSGACTGTMAYDVLFDRTGD